MRKNIAICMIIFIIAGFMTGCKDNEINITGESQNKSEETSDDLEKNESINKKEFEEREITLNENSKRILEDLLCEASSYQYERAAEKKDNNIPIIPNNDNDKIQLILRLFCDTDMNPSIHYEKYIESSSGSTLFIPLEDFQKILKDGLSTKLENPKTSKYYNNGKIVLSMGNRGDQEIAGTIKKAVQVSDDTVRIEAIVKNVAGGELVYEKNITATAKINNESMFGGYSLVSIAYDNNEISRKNSDYIIPDSNKDYLYPSVVMNLSKEELSLARNEIYARHGYIFKEEKYKKYFESKKWYKPDASFKGTDDELSDCEKYNIKLIKEWEEKK